MINLNASAGVWEDMETGETTAKTGIVTGVRTEGTDVILDIETTDELGSTETISAKYCNERPQEQTDAMAATSFNTRRTEAEAAKKAKTKLQFGTRGIWNGCLSFVRPQS
jgi:hypothetical protein